MFAAWVKLSVFGSSAATVFPSWRGELGICCQRNSPAYMQNRRYQHDIQSLRISSADLNSLHRLLIQTQSLKIASKKGSKRNHKNEKNTLISHSVKGIRFRILIIGIAYHFEANWTGTFVTCPHFIFPIARIPYFPYLRIVFFVHDFAFGWNEYQVW